MLPRPTQRSTLVPLTAKRSEISHDRSRFAQSEFIILIDFMVRFNSLILLAIDVVKTGDQLGMSSYF